MPYVPDISGFLDHFGPDANLIDILDKEVPSQQELRYRKNDISEFDQDIQIFVKAEDGYRVRLLVNNAAASVVTVRHPSGAFRSFYNSKGYLIRTPVFVFEGEPGIYYVNGLMEKDQKYFLCRKIKIKGSNETMFILRIWSNNTPEYIAPSKFELIVTSGK